MRIRLRESDRQWHSSRTIVLRFVTFTYVVRPAVLALTGTIQLKPAPMPVRAFSYKKKIGRRDYVRVSLRKNAGGELEAVKFPRDVELGKEITQVEPGQMVGFLDYSSLA